MGDDGDSTLANLNLCQSYLSLSVSMDFSESKMREFQEQYRELERLNMNLNVVLKRYDTELDDKFLESEILKRRVHELELSFAKTLQRDSFCQTDNQISQSYGLLNGSTQTEERHEKSSRPPRERKKTLNERICLFDRKYCTPQKGTSDRGDSVNSRSSRVSVTPDAFELDCEYFLSKKQIEKLVSSILSHVQQLQQDIHVQYPRDLSQEIIVESLGKIQDLTKFLSILLDDQLIQIRKFAEDLQNEANQLVEEARLISHHPCTEQSQASPHQPVTCNQQTPETSINNFSPSLQSPKDINIDQYLFSECDNMDISKTLILSENITPILSENITLILSENIDHSKSPIFSSLQPVETQDESQTKEEYEQVFEIQQKNQLVSEPDYLEKTGGFEELEENEEPNDQVEFQIHSQCEDLLQTLGDEEFDFDQNLSSHIFFQTKKKIPFKNQKNMLNKIMTFSFGTHPTQYIGNTDMKAADQDQTPNLDASLDLPLIQDERIQNLNMQLEQFDSELKGNKQFLDSLTSLLKIDSSIIVGPDSNLNQNQCRNETVQLQTQIFKKIQSFQGKIINLILLV